MGEELPYPSRTSGYVDCLTPAQDLALGDLYKQLPTALQGLSPEHLTLWGVPLEDLTSDSQQHQHHHLQQAKQQHQQAGADDDAPKNPAAACGPSRVQKVVLLKFLRARQFNVQAALSMLVNCLKWRRDFDVAGLSLETFPPQLGQAGQLSGRDRASNPVTYNYYGNDLDLQSVFSSPGGVATFIRWRVKLMEQAVGLLDFERGTEHVTQVHDYSGASMFRMDSSVKTASRQIIRLFQDNYPEMLSAKLFLNVPRVMEFVFGLFSAFSDAATRAKFVMASPARARAVLLQYIDPLQVPSRFGGFLETCSVPANHGRATSFSIASKKVVLKPGESHVTSKLVGADCEVVYCFCTTGPDINMTVGFRPRDYGEAAAAAARLPDHIPGVAHPNSRHRDAQHINQSHTMRLATDAASGRLVLGCPGEVVMMLDHNRTTGGFFGGAAPVTVHYSLQSSDPPPPAGGGGGGSVNGHTLNPHALISVASESSDAATAGARLYGGEGGGGFPQHPLDWRTRIISYKSFGCSSFTSNGDSGALADPGGAPPESPSGAGGGATGIVVESLLEPPPQLQLPGAAANGGIGGGAPGLSTVAVSRFETVQEADESGTVSPSRTTLTEVTGEVRLP